MSRVAFARADDVPFNAIADFLEQYCQVLDDGSVGDWSAFFEETAVYQVTTRENVDAGLPVGIILCEGRGMMDDRIKALNIANIYESHAFRHITGRPLIRKEREGRYAVHSSFSIFRIMYTGETELFASGRYQDIVTVAGASVQFAERRVVLDSRAVDTLIVYPL